MQLILDRIAGWEAAGLIDPNTAFRLRSDEQERAEPELPASVDKSDVAERRGGPSAIAQIVGPGVTIVEMFAYLGGAFVLGALDLFMTRAAGFDADGGVGLAVGYGIVAVVLIAIGRFMAQRDARERRAAGVLFAVAVGHVATAGFALTTAFNLDLQVAGVLVAAWASVVAVGLRLYLPALTTQFTLLASLTGLAAATDQPDRKHGRSRNGLHGLRCGRPERRARRVARPRRVRGMVACLRGAPRHLRADRSPQQRRPGHRSARGNDPAVGRDHRRRRPRDGRLRSRPTTRRPASGAASSSPGSAIWRWSCWR